MSFEAVVVIFIVLAIAHKRATLARESKKKEAQQKDTDKRASSWVCGNDTGLSSTFMWSVLTPANPLPRANHPRDMDDFGRCVRLLDCVPEWRPRMAEMAAHGRPWGYLVRFWSELEELYRYGKGEKGSLANSRCRAIQRLGSHIIYKLIDKGTLSVDVSDDWYAIYNRAKRDMGFPKSWQPEPKTNV